MRSPLRQVGSAVQVRTGQSCESASVRGSCGRALTLLYSASGGTLPYPDLHHRGRDGESKVVLERRRLHLADRGGCYADAGWHWGPPPSRGLETLPPPLTLHVLRCCV